MDSLISYLGKIAGSALIGLFEPRPVTFSTRNESQLPAIQKAILEATGVKLCRPAKPINRIDFLHGCLHVTEREPVEHLILGYGFKHGATTKIEAIHHLVGSEDAVALTTAMLDRLNRWEHIGERS